MNALPPVLRSLAALAAVLLLNACSAQSGFASSRAPESWRVQRVEHGKASFYSTRCNGGTRTASGDRLHNEALTAAHKTLPMGTKVRVVNLSNGKSEVVTINDRGPFIRGRVIDVTVGVARRLGFVSRGIAPVRIEVLAAPASTNRSQS
jgi:rare lipoprotein A